MSCFESFVHDAFWCYSRIFGTLGLFEQLFGKEGLLDLWLFPNFEHWLRYIISALNGLLSRDVLGISRGLLSLLLLSLTIIGLVEIIYVCGAINIENQGSSLSLMGSKSADGWS